MPNYHGVLTLNQALQALDQDNWPRNPAAPTIGTATAGDASASVTFTAPTDTGTGTISSYNVVSTPGGIVGTGASSPVTVSGLTNGTSYTFAVQAVTTAGTGPFSAQSNSVTPVLPTSPWTLVSSPTQVSVTSNLTLNDPGGLPNQYSDMQISPDGTKLSVWDGFNSEMKMYQLSSANTLGALSSPYNTASIGSFVTSFYWKPDGTKLIAAWWYLGRLYTYNTSAFTPSTIATDSVYTGGWGSAFSSQLTGMYVSDDGSKLFLAGDNKVARYNFGTAWTANTISYSSSFTVSGASNVLKVFFKSDGTRMFVTAIVSGVTEIRQYNLSTAWDLSTATLNSTFVTTSYNNTGRVGVSFTSNGENMYTASFTSGSAVRIWNTNA